MKKLIPVLMLLGISSFALGQQKYFAFEIDGKHGITDINGNEVVKPIYKYSNSIPAKNQIYLQDFSDRADMIFNTSTGTKQLYESVYNNTVKIKDVPYSQITSKGKTYLLSEESAKTINLAVDYSDFKNVGSYIIAKFYPPSPPAKSAGVDKNGRPLPPQIMPPPKENLAILSNDETLKRIMKTDFSRYIPLYKRAEEKKDDGLVKVEVLHLGDINKKEPNFDYILFTKGNTHSLYNSKMALVKTFVLAKADEDMLLEASKKIVKQNLSTSSENSYAYPPMMMVAPELPNKPRKNDIVEKKPFKPFFYVEELPNANTLFALQETEQISKHIFEAKKGVEVYLDKVDHLIRIEINGKEDSRFSFDPKTGALYLPQVYLANLGITLN